MSAEDMYKSVLTAAVLAEIERLASIAFDTVIEKWLDDEHSGKGVYFRAAFFAQAPQGFVPYQFMGTWLGGDKNRDGEVRYRAFSAEKIFRLHQHVTEGHVSASQSLIDGLNFKGAICVKVQLDPPLHMTEFERELLVLSASGLPDDADEAGLVELADLLSQRVFRLDRSQLGSLLKLSDNRLFQGAPDLRVLS